MAEKEIDRYNDYVFLDRDGVINVELGDYTLTREQWIWAPGSIEGIKLLTDNGFGVIVITNQSCISRGIQTEEGLGILHKYMTDTVTAAGGKILRVYHCPHQKSDNCTCRKPEPGMLLKAAYDFGIILGKTFFIGDAERDMIAGKKAGTRTIFIGNPGDDSFGSEYTAYDLLTAAKIVIDERDKSL